MLYIFILNCSQANGLCSASLSPLLLSPLVLGVCWSLLTLLSTSILLFESTFNNLCLAKPVNIGPPWRTYLQCKDGRFTLVPFTTWCQKRFCHLSVVGAFRGMELMGLWVLGPVFVFLWTFNVSLPRFQLMAPGGGWGESCFYLAVNTAFTTSSFGKHHVKFLGLCYSFEGGGRVLMHFILKSKIHLNVSAVDFLVNFVTELSFGPLPDD